MEEIEIQGSAITSKYTCTKVSHNKGTGSSIGKGTDQ